MENPTDTGAHHSERVRGLLVLELGTRRYGLWEDQIRETREVRDLHRFPGTHRWLSGVVVSDGSPVNLLNLSLLVCNLEVEVPQRGRALIIASAGKTWGFLYDRELERLDVREPDVLPMPEVMRSPTFRSCAFHDGELLPIMDVISLIQEALRRDASPLDVALRAEDSCEPWREAGGFRGFTIGGETFAMAQELLDHAVVSPGGPLSRVPNMPPDAVGLTHHQGQVITVLSLNQPLELPGHRGGDQLLLLKEWQAGFFVESDLGVLPRKLVERQMPPTVASRFFPSALVGGGEVIPVVDVRALLCGAAHRHRDLGPPTDSGFGELLGRFAVHVNELSLSAVTHSVPASEVEDVLEAVPYRRVPCDRSMVVGVAQHGDDVLPVLDLAVCFGKRTTSIVPKMILLHNGVFRALLLAESVGAREREVGPSEQRALPFSVPHVLVYGCYAAGGRLRLILNVEALATQMEHSHVALLAALELATDPKARTADAAKPARGATLRQEPDSPPQPAEEPAEGRVEDRAPAEIQPPPEKPPQARSPLLGAARQDSSPEHNLASSVLEATLVAESTAPDREEPKPVVEPPAPDREEPAPAPELAPPAPAEEEPVPSAGPVDAGEETAPTADVSPAAEGGAPTPTRASGARRRKLLLVAVFAGLVGVPALYLVAHWWAGQPSDSSTPRPGAMREGAPGASPPRARLSSRSHKPSPESATTAPAPGDAGPLSVAQARLSADAGAPVVVSADGGSPRLVPADSPPASDADTKGLKRPTLHKNAREYTLRHVVYFQSGRRRIRRDYQLIIGLVGRILKRHPTCQMLIEGHADDRGTRVFNSYLSYMRAKEVHQYLVDKIGVSARRLRLKGLGSRRMPRGDRSESARKKNRRVLFHLTCLTECSACR